MRSRILMNPTAPEGGGNPAAAPPLPSPSPTPQPAPQPAATTAPPTPPAPQPAPTPAPAPSGPSAEEFRALRAKLDKYEADERARQEQQSNAEVEKLRKAGDFEKIEQRLKAELEAERGRVEAERRKNGETLIDLRLSSALANHRLVPGWAEKLHVLFRPEFEALDRGDRYEVQSRDLKTVEAKVAELLASPEFKHIIQAPDAAGGAGSTQVRGAPPDGGGAKQFATTGEALVAAHMPTRPRARASLGGNLIPVSRN